MKAVADNLLERVGRSLSDALASRFTLWCVLLALNALALPYFTFNHDSRLYAAQILEKLYPGSFADDLYLRYGSQDRYTIFTYVAAPVVYALGIDVGFFLLYVISKGLFFAGAIRFVFAVLKDATASQLALILLANTPITFGGNQVFHVNESFLTPRIAACALVLFGLERLLADKRIAAVGFLAGTFVLHPIMALAGILVTLGYWCLGTFSVRSLVIGALVAVAATIGILAYEPLGTTLLGHIDDEWKDVTLHICFFVKPSVWNASDWMRIAIAFLVGIEALVSYSRAISPLLGSVIGVAVVGLVGQFVAVECNYLLLIQASPYRTLWLLEFLSIPLGVLWCVTLWRRNTSASRAASLGLVVLLTADWHHEMYSSFALFLIVSAIAAVAWRGLARQPREQDWCRRSTSVGFVITTIVLVILNFRIMALGVSLVPSFALDSHPYALLTLGSMMLYKLPLLLVALYLPYKLIGFIGSGTMLRLTLFTLCLVYQAAAAVIPRTEWYGAGYTAHGRHVQYVTDQLRARLRPDQERLTVYWPGDLRFCWLEAGMNSYYNVVQMSGCGFNRGTALEGKRRALLAQSFELEYFGNIAVSESWLQTLASFFGVHARNVRPSTDDLLLLCRDETLDFVVLERPVGDLPCATDGGYYIYDCRALRESERAAGLIPAEQRAWGHTAEINPAARK